MLLLTTIPVHAVAVDRSLPGFDISFSPHDIPLGYSSTMTVTVTAPSNSDMYFLAGLNFEEWIRWQTTQVRFGDFVHGGLVFLSANQNYNLNYFQVALVALKGTTAQVQIPVFPSRAGIFHLVDVFELTLPVVNGSLIINSTSYGAYYVGLKTGYQNFEGLTVYDPQLQAVNDKLDKIIQTQSQEVTMLSVVASAIGNLDNHLNVMQSAIQDGFSTLATGVQNGFNGISNQTSMLASQQKAEFRFMESQYHYVTNALYILFGMSILILLYLFWFTYRLSRQTRLAKPPQQ